MSFWCWAASSATCAPKIVAPVHLKQGEYYNCTHTKASGRILQEYRHTHALRTLCVCGYVCYVFFGYVCGVCVCGVCATGECKGARSHHCTRCWGTSAHTHTPKCMYIYIYIYICAHARTHAHTQKWVVSFCSFVNKVVCRATVCGRNVVVRQL